MPAPRKVSARQMEILVEFAESNPYIALGRRFSGGPQTVQVIQEVWNAVADKLNSVAEGIAKSPDKWRRYWIEYKAKTKGKAADSRRYAATGGGANKLFPLTELEKRVLAILGPVAVEESPGVRLPGDCPTSTRHFQRNVSAREETSAPGPSSQQSGLNIEDAIQAGSAIKVELDSSDSDDPLNFEEEYLLSSDSQTPELKLEPEPEPEIEQPKHTTSETSRRKRVRRVLRRPITHSRLDTMNHLTVNEVRKALIEKNEIKKQFYAEYMVEIRKQTKALITIARKLSER